VLAHDSAAARTNTGADTTHLTRPRECKLLTIWEDLQITNMAVPLSQLTAADADEPTIETIGD